MKRLSSNTETCSNERKYYSGDVTCVHCVSNQIVPFEVLLERFSLNVPIDIFVLLPSEL